MGTLLHGSTGSVQASAKEDERMPPPAVLPVARCPLPLCAIAIALVLASSSLARAGGTSLDDRDEMIDSGPSIFGWARTVASLAPLAEARVTADSKLAPTSLVTRTDQDGAFRFSGLGDDFPLDAVEVSCAKDGFRMIDIVVRRLSRDPRIPLEVECVMEPT